MKDRIFKVPSHLWECCGQLWSGNQCRTCGKQRPICGNGSNFNVPPRDGLPTDLREMLKKEPSKRKTPRGQGMNSGEKKVFGVLKAEHPDAMIVPHGLKVAFGDGTTYTPDLVIYHSGGRIELVETKGGYRGPGAEQGIERFRRAMAVFGRWYAFRLVDSRNIAGR